MKIQRNFECNDCGTVRHTQWIPPGWIIPERNKLLCYDCRPARKTLDQLEMEGVAADSTPIYEYHSLRFGYGDQPPLRQHEGASRLIEIRRH